MANSQSAVLLEPTPDGAWQATIPAIPDIRATGSTSNQALAALDTKFNEWYRASLKAAPKSAYPGMIWKDVFHGLQALYIQEPKSAPGDFYVESSCCTACGVPQSVAPDLVGWTEEPFVSCYWKKQPENSYELNQAFKIFDGQELDCHRYAGHDPAIQQRIGYTNSDFPPTVVRQVLRRLNPIHSGHWGEAQPSPKPSESHRPSLWSRLFKRR